MKRLGILASGIALGAAALPALPAGAAGSSSANLAAPTVSVRTSSGQTLRMSLGATRSGGATRFAMRLEDPSSAGDESHTWSFAIPSSGLTYASPKGKLVTGTKLAAYGAVSLVFRKVSSSTRSCTGYSGATKVATTVVKFSGTVNFAALDTSGPSQWGTVKEGSGTSPYTFGGKKGVFVTTTNGPCKVAVPMVRCSDRWTWALNNNSSGNTQVSLAGDSRDFGTVKVSTITGFRGQTLSTPGGASRIDVNVVPAPSPQANTGIIPNSLQVTTTDGSAASGGGTLTATGNPVHPPGGKCKKADGTTTTQTASYWTATWRNDQSTLVVSMTIGGGVAIPDGNVGYFEHLATS